MDVSAPAPTISTSTGGSALVPPNAPPQPTLADTAAGALKPANINLGNPSLLVSSTPARSATADNVTKLQTITTPPPAGQVQNQQVQQPNGTNIYVSGTTDANKGPAGTTGATPPPPSTTPATNADGTPNYDSAVAGISDPGLAAQFKTSLQNIDSQISQAQSTITSIQGRSLNDPAVTGIVSAIQAKYNQQIQLMKDKNSQLIGRANTSVAAFGGLGVMSQDFLNNEQSRADARIQDLQNQEDAAIAKAQSAYLSQNAKDLNDAMTQYDKVNQEKLSALNNLLTASSKQVTQMQAQQKIDLQAQKDQLNSDVVTSTKISAGVASNIKAAGITDPSEIKSYISGIAAQYGISNPDLLYSQVVTAGQTLDKNSLGMANTVSQINTREANLSLSADRLALAKEKEANPKISAADKKSNFYAGLPQLSGKADSGGTPYYYTSTDDNQEYLTTEGFATLLAAGKIDGVSRGTFIKDNPDLFDPNKLESYGLTAREKAVVQQ